AERTGRDVRFGGRKAGALKAGQRGRSAGDESEQTRGDIALACQQAGGETLSVKGKRALKQTGLRGLVIAGGGSANKALRASLESMLGDWRGHVYYARPEVCTDNGALTAFAGCQRLQARHKADLSIHVPGRWPTEPVSGR
ncbi:tRNA (adenosine(37)-N6)-threonylcarbamoyltransferase complex transferase subunit TsaD, partial [Pseudomonas syringae]